MSKKRIIGCLTVLSSLLIFGIFITLQLLSSSAYATAPNELLKKIQYSSLPTICYSGDGGFPSTFDGNERFILANFLNPSSDAKVTLPGYYEGTRSNNLLAANWYQVLLGAKLDRTTDVGQFNGLAQTGYMYQPTDFGYTPARDATVYDKRCAYLQFNLRENPKSDSVVSGQESNKICLPADEDDNIIIDDLWKDSVEVASATGNTHPRLMFSPNDNAVVISNISGDNRDANNTTDIPVCYAIRSGTAGYDSGYACGAWTNFISQLELAAMQLSTRFYGNESATQTIYPNAKAVDAGGDSAGTTAIASEYTLQRGSAQIALRFLTGNSSAVFSDYEFTETDWAVLYRYYYNEMIAKHGDTLTVSSRAVL